MNRNKLYADLARDEGKRLRAYKDSLGYWTIGVGHLLGDQMRMAEITEEECRILFDLDVETAESTCHSVFGQVSFVILDDVRQRALVNMAFNRGEQHMQESTTITPAIRFALKTMRDDDWRAVSEAIKVSPWAKQIGKRAERLAYMLETGKDPA